MEKRTNLQHEDDLDREGVVILDVPSTLQSVWRWWGGRVAALDSGHLATPTRCAGWTVHDLVAHITPDPAQLAAVLSQPLDADPAVRDAATLLRGFNAPGGVAHAMADDIEAAAVATAPALPVEDAASRFEAAADLIDPVAFDPDVVMPHPVVGSLTASALTDVAIVDATVHSLDLVAAVAGSAPPASALRRTRDVLVAVPEVPALLDVLTGRADAASILPVMR